MSNCITCMFQGQLLCYKGRDTRRRCSPLSTKRFGTKTEAGEKNKRKQRPSAVTWLEPWRLFRRIACHRVYKRGNVSHCRHLSVACAELRDNRLGLFLDRDNWLVSRRVNITSIRRWPPLVWIPCSVCVMPEFAGLVLAVIDTVSPLQRPR